MFQSIYLSFPSLVLLEIPKLFGFAPAKNNSPLQNSGIPHENGNSSSCTVLVTLTSFSFWLEHSLFSLCFLGHRDAHTRDSKCCPAVPAPSPALCSHSPGKAPAQQNEEGQGAHPAWEKVPMFFCVLPTKAVQEERRTGLAAWLNVVMKAGTAHATRGDTTLRGESPPLNLQAKMNSGLGKLFAKMEKQSPAGAAA